jgi:hypothetical protein
MDFRNAIKWYQYDPTKWTIWVLSKLGLASHLKVFPDNEVRKGQLTMQLKKLRETQEHLTWPTDSNDLPVISWESCKYPFSLRLILSNCHLSPKAIQQEAVDTRLWIYPRCF